MTGSAPPRSGSRRISPSLLNRVPWWRKFAAGSARGRERRPLPAERIRPASRRRTALLVLAAYAAAWAVGIGFGFLLRALGVWSGADWERETLRWFHERPLPRLLDSMMLAAPLFGTNL